LEDARPLTVIISHRVVPTMGKQKTQKSPPLSSGISDRYNQTISIIYDYERHYADVSSFIREMLNKLSGPSTSIISLRWKGFWFVHGLLNPLPKALGPIGPTGFQRLTPQSMKVLKICKKYVTLRFDLENIYNLCS
jgi:hypothetical protein